jgi:hypothetical protein
MPDTSPRSWIIQISVAFALVIAGYVWFRGHYDPRYIAIRCEKRAKKDINVEELQSWAVRLLRQYPPDTTNYSGPFSLPRGVTNVWDYPPHVSLVASSHVHEAHLRLLWGSGALGHWGFWLGSTNITAPGAKWQPGVFWWKEFDR